MKITDLYGKEREVTDLDKAIEQTEFFKDCEHIPPYESDKERKAYWGDMYQKLCELKTKQFLKNELEEVLLSYEEDNHVLNLNGYAISVLRNRNLIESPYNGLRNHREVVKHVINQLEANDSLKEALNILPYKTAYEPLNYKAREKFEDFLFRLIRDPYGISKQKF